MQMQFKVVYQDGRSLDVTARPRDFVNFERQSGKSIVALRQSPTMEAIYYLAWSALHGAGQEPGDFDSFLTVVDDVESVDDEDVEPDPTGADSSASSAN